MTNCTVASIILRDLIIKGENPRLDVYTPLRKTNLPAAKEFVVQNTNVAGQLLDGKLEKPPGIVLVMAQGLQLMEKL